MDAAEATHDAVYEALAAPGAVTLATVYSHPPEDADMPLVVIADLSDALPIGSAGDPDSRLTITILTLTQAEEKRSCLARQAEVNAALDGKVLTSIDGWRIALALEQKATELDEEGLGYVGTNVFSVLALSD